MSKKIYLSPSNQSGNTYAYGNTNECDQCNRIADAAKEALERCGFTVKKAPKGQDMSKSIAESNAWGADLHLPIHTNAGGGSGTMCMVYTKAGENMQYATPIYKSVQAVTPGRTEYGIRAYPELAELNGTNCIAVYTEVDFHDNKTIAKWIIENVKMVGEAFAKGVCTACNVAYVAPGEKVAAKPATVAVSTRKSFGLVYTTVKGDGVEFNDAGDLIHLVYNATASPSERAYKSINESPEAVTFSWEFTTTPVDMPSVTVDNDTTTFKKSSLITIDTTKFTTTEQQTRLALLKDALYGTDGVGNNDTGTAPTLPTPAQVLGILNGTITSLSGLTG